MSRFEWMGGTEIGACAIWEFCASSLLLWHPFRLLMTFTNILKAYLIKTAELLFPFCCAEILTYCFLTSFSWHWRLYHLLVGFYLSWPDFVCTSTWGRHCLLFHGLTAVAATRHTASCVCQSCNHAFTHEATSSTSPLKEVILCHLQSLDLVFRDLYLY